MATYCYRRRANERELAGVGVHAPAATSSGAPTAGDPTMAGAVVGATTRSLKWMNPVGQPPPDLVTCRQ